MEPFPQCNTPNTHRDTQREVYTEGVHTPLKSTFSDVVSSWLANMLYVQNRVFKKQTNLHYKIITQINPEGLVGG